MKVNKKQQDLPLKRFTIHSIISFEKLVLSCLWKDFNHSSIVMFVGTDCCKCISSSISPLMETVSSKCTAKDDVNLRVE